MLIICAKRPFFGSCRFFFFFFNRKGTKGNGKRKEEMSEPSSEDGEGWNGRTTLCEEFEECVLTLDKENRVEEKRIAEVLLKDFLPEMVDVVRATAEQWNTHENNEGVIARVLSWVNALVSDLQKTIGKPPILVPPPQPIHPTNPLNNPTFWNKSRRVHVRYWRHRDRRASCRPGATRQPTSRYKQRSKATRISSCQLGSDEMLERLCTTFKKNHGETPSAPQLTMLLQEYAHRYRGLSLARGKGRRLDGAYTYAPENILLTCGRSTRVPREH